MRWILMLVVMLLMVTSAGCGVPFDGAGQAGNGSKITVTQQGHQGSPVATVADDEFRIELDEEGKLKAITIPAGAVANILNLRLDMQDGGTLEDVKLPLPEAPTTQPTPSPTP